MRRDIPIAAGALLLLLGMTVSAEAAGRVSRFAALERLSSPFDTIDVSSLSASAFGLPVFRVDSVVTSPPLNVTAPASATPLAAPAPSSVRVPYRPRVRSPFRPPPRPSIP